MTTQPRTFTGEASTPDHGHTGWPPDPEIALHRLRKGLPAYWPTDPTTIDQRPYAAFAATRGANTA